MIEKNLHLQPTPMRTMPNGGQLRVGNPGNRGGAGAMSNELRERLRGSLEERMNTLEEVIDDESLRPADRLRAIELLLKYGIGVAKDSESWDRWSVVELVADLGAVVARHVDANTLGQIKEGWHQYFTITDGEEEADYG